MRFAGRWIVLFLLPLTVALGAEEQRPASPAADHFALLPVDDELNTVSLVGTRSEEDDGTELEGVRVGIGRWDGTGDMSPIQGGFWLSYESGEERQALGGGVELGLPILVIFGPRFTLGLGHRDGYSHEGLHGIAGIGLELDLWLGPHVALAASADKQFDFPGDSRNQLALTLRLGMRTAASKLVSAVQAEDSIRVHALLAHGINVNRSMFNGDTAIYAAALNCDAAMLRLLLDSGVDLEGHAAELALRTVVEDCSIEAVRAMVEKGADSNATYYTGPTILMHAVTQGDADKVELLLAHGADPNRPAHWPRIRPDLCGKAFGVTLLLKG